jgi:thiamine biosynthesis lipoprotein
LTRRRFIGVTAAAAGLGLLPVGGRGRAEASVVDWHGEAMGAVASLRIHHSDRGAAEALIRRAVAEVRRLERVFSLYRDDSALVALNRHGMLAAPPPDLVEVLAQARHYWQATHGSFDPSVQPLWTLYRDHFSTPGAAPSGPSSQSRDAALALVGLDGVAFDRNRIAFRRRGMGLTLNGIAQGYATDRVVGILRAGGIVSSLVDLGEPRALGPAPDGHPWRIGIADPDGLGAIAETVEVADRAVATSGGYGFRFDAEGRFNHLLDPKSGRSAALYRSVTVLLPDATGADALSTAFSLLPKEEISSVLHRLGDGEVRLVTAGGERIVLSPRGREDRAEAGGGMIRAAARLGCA